MKGKLMAVQFSEDKEFLRCIELLTTSLDPGAAVQVVAPRIIILQDRQVAQCEDQGIQFWQVVPVTSLSELPPEEELRIRREHLAQFHKRWEFLGGVGAGGVRLILTRPKEAR